MSEDQRCRGTITADVLLPALPAMTRRGYGEEMYLVSTVPPPDIPRCAVSPKQGSVLTAFTVSCSAPCLADSCQSSHNRQLTYCFYLKSSKSWGDLFGKLLLHVLARTVTVADKSKGTTCFCSSARPTTSQPGLHRASPGSPGLREGEVSVWCLVGDPLFPISDSLLHCGSDPELFPVYLPLGEEEDNYILHMTITVSNNFGDTVRTNASVKVHRRMTLSRDLSSWYLMHDSLSELLPILYVLLPSECVIITIFLPRRESFTVFFLS